MGQLQRSQLPLSVHAGYATSAAILAVQRTLNLTDAGSWNLETITLLVLASE